MSALFNEQDTHDMDSEYALIGHCLCDQGLPEKLLDITPPHFHSLVHADIWQAICQIKKNGQVVSPFTILPLLKRQEDMLIEPKQYLGGAISHASIYLHPLEIEKYLIRLAKRRSFQSVCASASESMTPDAAKQVTEAARALLEPKTPEQFMDSYQVTERILEGLKLDLKPYSTGIRKLDDAMEGGLYPRKSYGFAARKKMGKTMLAGTISYNLSMDGIKHLFICGEMSPEEIHTRSLGRHMNTKPAAFRLDYGKTPDFGHKLAKAAKELQRNILYRNAPGLTFDELRCIVDDAVNIHNIKGLILDYWQLVGGKTNKQSTAEHLDDVAQWIADYCRKKDLWSIVMAQINQEGNTRGGEGIRLAFDQVYELKAKDDKPNKPERWLEMKDTRYTAWYTLGDEHDPSLRMNEKGTHFDQN